MLGHSRAGLTLLEVLVALALLGLASAAWAGLMGQSIQTVLHVEARDREVQRAALQLARVSLWSRDQLGARIGTSAASDFVLRVSEIAPGLFDVTVADTLAGAPLLRTSFYARGANAPR